MSRVLAPRICRSSGASKFTRPRANSLPSQLTEVPDPKAVAVVSYTQVDVGPNHVCAVSSAQDIWCFGFNTSGQFGTGLVDTTNTRTWEPVSPVIR